MKTSSSTSALLKADYDSQVSMLMSKLCYEVAAPKKLLMSISKTLLIAWPPPQIVQEAHSLRQLLLGGVNSQQHCWNISHFARNGVTA